MSKLVLVVGATGWLGHKITNAIVARGIPTRVALRGGSAHQKAGLFNGRAEIVSADLADGDSLVKAAKGVDTIVSVVQGGPAEIIDGQVALARAGVEAGVKRIIPSDFSIDFRGVSTDRHLFLGWREQADRAIEKLGLAQNNIFNGAFTEILGLEFFEMMDFKEGQVKFWGDPDQKYDFTATKDVAEFTAEVVKDRERVGPQMVNSERASPRQLAEIASQVFGRAFKLSHLGSLADLDVEISSRQAAHPQNPMAWAALQYQRMMASSEGALTLPVTTGSFVSEPTTIYQFFSGLKQA
ncbi:NmrA family NAD(P)-binding protein [Burkholderia paludis]|uniref:NmrA family NAD(P)-binding protein n=1 Tax=Burkholderia paludis TaxID=1506587 RepID=UPI000947071B|nr:NmrA family NAD(P)-binding protein [Burkholderia paludis]